MHPTPDDTELESVHAEIGGDHYRVIALMVRAVEGIGPYNCRGCSPEQTASIGKLLGSDNLQLKNQTGKLMKLRGHHLICLHFYRGLKAEPGYRKNLHQIISRAEDNEAIDIVFGSDDVCSHCPHLSSDMSCSFEEGADLAIKGMDKKAFELLNLQQDDHVHWSALKQKISDILEIWKDTYCNNCSWSEDCTIFDTQDSACEQIDLF